MFLKVCCLKVALEKKKRRSSIEERYKHFYSLQRSQKWSVREASSPKHPHHIIGEKKRKKALSLPNKKKKKNKADIFAKKLLFIFDTFDHFIYP